MEPSSDDLPARLAPIHQRLAHPPGVMLGVLRLPVLDGVLDDLEMLEQPAITPEVVGELERPGASSPSRRGVTRR